MNRKKFAFYLWEKNLIPLLLIIAGILASYFLTVMFNDFILIDFLAEFALKAIVLLFLAYSFIWILKKTTLKFPTNIPIRKNKISYAFNHIITWIMPIGLGAMLYETWINGSQRVVIGYSAIIIFLKMRNLIRVWRNTTHAQTNL